MIVTLEQVKTVLGIDHTNTDEDERLTLIITEVSAWVEGVCKCRFDTPIPRTEYLRGTGERSLFVQGNIDDTVVDSGDPLVIDVAQRDYGSLGEWSALTDGEDYERRGREFIAPLAFCGIGWNRWSEFRIMYPDGYHTAPLDIQQLVIEMTTGQYITDVEMAGGTAGVTSESIGDYSYNVDLKAFTAAGTAGGGTLSAVGRGTIGRYQRKYA